MLTAEGSIVVKIGGSTLGAHDTSLVDLAAIHRAGRRVIVVHGGGPAISEWLKRLDTPTRFVRGLRVTDAAALDVVVAVLAGMINKQLVASLTALGAAAVGLSGADGSMLTAVYDDQELGFVGRITHVDATVVTSLLDAGFLPVIAPLALLAERSQLLNVNGDTAAGELAAALHAERLVFLTDVDGVRGEDGEVVQRLGRARADAMLAADVIAGGMIPKVEAGLRAASAGSSCVIVDGRKAGSLTQALLADPPGTVIECT